MHPPKSAFRMPIRFLVILVAVFSAIPSFAQTGTQALRSGGFIKPTTCKALNEEQRVDDEDIHVASKATATLNVMFHGNRFVAAQDLVNAFEQLHPGERLAWTAIPPINSVKAIRSNGKDAGMAGEDFMPDVVLGPITLMESARQPSSTEASPLINTGIYSKIKGLVLMARADDDRVQLIDWRSIAKNEKIKIILPGDQPRKHALIKVYDDAFGAEWLDALAQTSRVGASALRHHRSIPARILAGCEDVGIQFLQSKYYWERKTPGVFRYSYIPISLEELEAEDSYAFLVRASPRSNAAGMFADFIKSDAAKSILKGYDLEP